MGTGDRFAEITAEEMQEYIDSEGREAELEAESDLYEESDFDDEPIKDENTNANEQSLITLNEILNSATLKLELCQYIGASNWRRWKQLKQANEAWDEIGI